MSTFWPGWTCARSTSACQAVRATSGTDAASAIERLAGLLREVVLVHGDALGERADAAVARAAVDLVARRRTASPPRPTAVTTPARSWPRTNGGLVGEQELELAVRIFASSRLTPAAWISTSTSWSPTVGSGSVAERERALVPVDEVGLHRDGRRPEGTRGRRGRTARGTGRCRRARSPGRSSAWRWGSARPARRRLAAGDHDVVVAVGDERRLGDLAEVVRLRRGRPRGSPSAARCAPAWEIGLSRSAGALLQPGDVLGRRALAGRRSG